MKTNSSRFRAVLDFVRKAKQQLFVSTLNMARFIQEIHYFLIKHKPPTDQEFFDKFHGVALSIWAPTTGM